MFARITRCAIPVARQVQPAGVRSFASHLPDELVAGIEEAIPVHGDEDWTLSLERIDPKQGYVDTAEFGPEQGRITIQELYPAIDGDVSVNIYVGQRDNPGDDVTWSDPYTFDPTSGEVVNVRHTARHFRLRFETIALDSPFSLERCQVNYTEAGRR